MEAEEKERFLKAFDEWKTDIFSRFCLNKCETTCCDLSQTFLKTPKEELIKILGKEPEDLKKYEIIEYGFMKYQYKEGVCPQYDKQTKKCRIYAERPEGCRAYPFWLYEKKHSKGGLILVQTACFFSEEHKEFKDLCEFGAEYSMTAEKLKTNRFWTPDTKPF